MAEDPLLVTARANQELARTAKRDEVLSSKPTAAYMQERINVLVKSQLLKNYTSIVNVATTQPGSGTPTLLDTANRQLTADTASMGMIRAAEELMVLTRTMKELWLFGEMDAVGSVHVGDAERERQVKDAEDESAVVKGMQEWLRRNARNISHGSSEAESRAEDEEMASD